MATSPLLALSWPYHLSRYSTDREYRQGFDDGLRDKFSK